MSCGRHRWRGVEGDVLFLDLDVVITAGLDDFFDFKPDGSSALAKTGHSSDQELAIRPFIAFASCRFIPLRPISTRPGGDSGAVTQQPDSTSRTSSASKHFGRPHGARVLSITLLPDWPLNFVRAATLPASTKVVAFTGKPDPDEARDGWWPVEERTRRYISSSVQPLGSPSIGVEC